MWTIFLLTAGVLLAGPSNAATTSTLPTTTTPPTTLLTSSTSSLISWVPSATPDAIMMERMHWELRLYANPGCTGSEFFFQGYDPLDDTATGGCLNTPSDLPRNISAEESCLYAVDNGLHETNCSVSGAVWPTAAKSLLVLGGTCLVYANGMCEFAEGEYRAYAASQGCTDLDDGGTDVLPEVASVICGVQAPVEHEFACSADQDCVDAGIQCVGPDNAWEVVCSPETTCLCEPAGWSSTVPDT